MTKDSIISIGIMTGNSLDAVDVVMTEFTQNRIKDICGHSLPIPQEIANNFRELKQLLINNNGDIQKIVSETSFKFDELLQSYTDIIVKTIEELIIKSGIPRNEIDIIGFHGQTCAHYPSSISINGETHTLQIGSGQMLADALQIPVAFDFRSDDVMNGGEGAPLAPVHNQHIAQDFKTRGLFPLAFCNGGNTGNIAVISTNKQTNKEIVMGWDTGPFNHFIDYLTRSEKHEECDFNGKYGRKGKVNYELVRALFTKAVQTQNGDNFITKNPPKSSDPAWYKIIPELTDNQLSFEDRIRTAEFFSAYIFAYNLSLIPEEINMPQYFLIFGGGWRNPIVQEDFRNLVQGYAEILNEHQAVFDKIKNPQAVIEWSDNYEYSGQFMEARIFADMAKCCLAQEPFSYPETTGCKSPTIGGIIAYPNENNPLKWSRAAKGWQSKQ